MSSERGERLGRRKITDRSWGKLASLLQIKSTRTSRSYTLCTANPRPQPLSLWEVFVARNYFWLGSSERGVIISTTVKRFFLSRRSKRESFSAFDQMSRVISLRAVFKRLVHSIARNCTDGFSHHLCKKKNKKCVYCVNVRSEISFFLPTINWTDERGKAVGGFWIKHPPAELKPSQRPPFSASHISDFHNYWSRKYKTARRLLLLCKCKES